MEEANLGIDVSKGYADFVLLDSNKKQLEEVFQLDDTRSGHDCLKKQLQEMIKVHLLSKICCAVESTGGFENNWYASLMQWSKTMPLKVTRLNPSGVKQNIHAGLNRNVTDALSARYIAEYIIAHPQAVTYDKQNVEYASFRSLHKHINLQKKQQTQLVNQLKAVLYSAFPELMR
ncbi:MAG: transposase, partial [archaeon]